MLKRIVGFVILFAVLIAPFAQLTPAQAFEKEKVPDTFPPPQAHYFPETGHSAVNYFLDTWKKTPNALFTLGFPISQPFIEESFTNPGEYYRVQYFERAVLEEHPEEYGKQGNKFYVMGRLLGTQLAKGREAEQPFAAVADPGDGSFIPETKHTLRNKAAPFRTFWEKNGGVAVFGYPLSEQFQEINKADGQTYWVQYFERQRMEWHPNEKPEYQILLGLLGNEYKTAHHGDKEEFKFQAADGTLPRSFVYGYNATLYWQGTAWQDRKRVLAVSKNSGVKWLRQQVQWKYLHDKSLAIYWQELDDIVEDCSKEGVNLLISVVKSPTWATSNGSDGLPAREHFSTFANFMGSMAERYKGKVQAYEVWNEQNRACENGGDCSKDGGIGGQVANADYYVDLLAAAYDAIKAKDPYALVVSGAPTSTETNRPDIAISDVTFIKEMLRSPNFRADVIGMHPGGQYNPPDTMWPDQPGPGPSWQNSREFYFRRIEDIHQAMVDVGMGDRQLWVTEFGWATANNTPGYEYGNSISFETQAQWIVRAFQKGRHDYAPWVGAMFLWNLNFAISAKGAGEEQHEQGSFGVLNGDWSPRPAWNAIQAMPKD